MRGHGSGPSLNSACHWLVVEELGLPCASRSCLSPQCYHLESTTPSESPSTTPDSECVLTGRDLQVAVQLGQLDEAERLYAECGRYDLLNELLQASGEWDRALKMAEDKDRIHLKVRPRPSPDSLTPCVLGPCIVPAAYGHCFARP